MSWTAHDERQFQNLKKVRQQLNDAAFSLDQLISNWDKCNADDAMEMVALELRDSLTDLDSLIEPIQEDFDEQEA